MMDPKQISEKSKRDLIITAILLLIFAFFLTKNVFLRKGPAPLPSAAPAANNAAKNLSEELILVTNIRVNDRLKKERIALWDKEWARDPFAQQLALSSIMKAVNLTLKGILWDEKSPKAVVNDKTLLEGDTIYGYTIVRIKPRSVILKTGEKNIELQVFQPVLDEAVNEE